MRDIKNKVWEDVNTRTLVPPSNMFIASNTETNQPVQPGNMV